MSMIILQVEIYEKWQVIERSAHVETLLKEGATIYIMGILKSAIAMIY